MIFHESDKTYEEAILHSEAIIIVSVFLKVYIFYINIFILNYNAEFILKIIINHFKAQT